MTEMRLTKDMLPADEAIRVEKLKSFNILHTHAEKSFDTIAALAAEVFNVPMAGITFVTDEEVFFKSEIGNIKRSSLRSENLCALAILDKHSTLITDKASDPGLSRYNGNIRFYAAAPLLTEDGYAIGTICVSDVVPHYPESSKINALKLLADMVMDKLEMRMAVRKSLQVHDDRLHVLIHDLKNPMTTISLQSELMGRIPGVDDKIASIAGKINTQSKNIINKLNYILSSAKSVKGSFKLQKERLSVAALFDEIVQITRPSLLNKSQNIRVDIVEDLEIYSEKEKFIEIFKQLIGNANKFAEHGTEINVEASGNADTVTIKVKDMGPGLTETDLDQIFTKFANMSSFPTDGENTNGLGLSLVKMLVDLHKGQISAASDGKGLGTTFIIELPFK